MARHPPGLASQRVELQLQLRQGAQAARHHPRPRLGHQDPDRRLARRRHEAHLRLVRRGHRLPVGIDRMGQAHRQSRRLARLVERPQRSLLHVHGQGQHRLPLGHLALDAARRQWSGQPRRRPQPVVRDPRPADRGRQFRVPHHEGLEGRHLPRPRHLRRRLSARIRPGLAALLHLGGRPRSPRHRFHLGRVRPSQQHRVGQRVGQPREPLGFDGPQEQRRHSAGSRIAAGRCRTARAQQGCLRHGRHPAGAAQVQAGDHRGDAGGEFGQSVPVSDRTLEAEGRHRPSRHGAARRFADRLGCQYAADALLAALRAAGVRTARR